MQTATPVRGLAGWLRKRSGAQAFGLLLPSLIFLGVFFVVPLFIVVAVSFATRSEYGGVQWSNFNLDSYKALFTNFAGNFDPLYINIFVRSIWFALLTTVLCLLVGYPFAYFIARRSEKRRAALLLLVMIPFWTNFLVRTYAWELLFRKEGPVNGVLQWAGLIDQPLQLLFTNEAVVVGLVYGFLPFMVVPLYAAIEKFDFSLIEAAQDLGAGTFYTLRRILIPLTMPGILAGSILVFVPVVGSYVTSDILGGGKTIMIGNSIQTAYLKNGNWPFGSAMSIALMALVMAATLIYFRVAQRGGVRGEVV
jgi:spermidine/putrescine transport system permease protein